MANLWYTIPKQATVNRWGDDEPAMALSQGFGGTDNLIAMGMDGGLTLKEAEDLQWRLKQGIHLLKYGKLPRQHA